MGNSFKGTKTFYEFMTEFQYSSATLYLLTKFPKRKIFISKIQLNSRGDPAKVYYLKIVYTAIIRPLSRTPLKIKLRLNTGLIFHQNLFAQFT